MTEREALKLALEALEKSHICPLLPDDCAEAITAIKEALAQPEQEPVAWGVDWGRAGDIPCVSIIKRLPDGGIKVMAVEYAPYSYTSPPQCTWVGLTDKEIDQGLVRTNYAMQTAGAWRDGVVFAMTKLKEKNSA